MKWHRFIDRDEDKEQYIVPHYVSDEFLNSFIEDMKLRFNCQKYELIEQKENLYMDLGGMLMVGRPEYKFKLDEFTTIEIPCEDVAFLLHRFSQKKPRSFIGGTIIYYKLHTWISNLILNENQYKELIKQMKSSVDECEILSMKFLKERENNGLPTLPRVNGSVTPDVPPVYFDLKDKNFKPLNKRNK